MASSHTLRKICKYFLVETSSSLPKVFAEDGGPGDAHLSGCTEGSTSLPKKFVFGELEMHNFRPFSVQFPFKFATNYQKKKINEMSNRE